MLLLRTSLVLETSQRHLTSIPDHNLDKLEISSYLARVSAVMFYAEMEERVKEIVGERFADGGDRKLAHFLRKTNDGLLKRMKRKELAETISLFGDDCKEAFLARFPPEELDSYSNVIRDRHDTSHGEGADVTLSEVAKAAAVAERMLAAIREIIA